MGMSTESKIPRELNWVEARATCTIAKVFDQLCIGVANDIIAVNAIKYKELYFKQESLRDGTIVIGQPNGTPRVTVAIGIADQKIMVRDQATPIEWSVVVGLNDEGRCTLRLCNEKGESTACEMEQWQFRKKALESLFFGVRP